MRLAVQKDVFIELYILSISSISGIVGSAGSILRTLGVIIYGIDI